MKVVKELKFNWPLVGLVLLGMGIWYSIFVNGFFITTIWLIVFTAVIGLWIRLTGRG